VGHVHAHNTKETQPDIGNIPQESSEQAAENQAQDKLPSGMDSVEAEDPLGLGERDDDDWDDSEASFHGDESGSDCDELHADD
jgi:hypothetical protein